ncbi:PEP-CTERM sorting domain-containing protein [Verrucomicrobiaceae bacterium N1E253]|uniref:PEP-CTERM sorting domain-containing protein n=1 Tax=Oceaniferula marina TaxID=2748318 RepID=A0A851GE27_9BACT|nr:PEP-CTERM sorting domain-containing protein [Oceaniferula marina]NWK55676.1 PEP-CTERM sorting domain-containing protein [Oceaniferula marina]
MRLKTIIAATAVSLGTSIASQAAVTLTNGDFETGGNWNSDHSTIATGWTDALSGSGTQGNYGESITGYGTGRVAAMKGVSNAYHQQILGGVDAGTNGSYVINYDGGIRYHSSYSSAARTVTLRVALWDATTNTELAFVDVGTAYSNAETTLHAREHTLTYDPTGLDGNDLALRFSNATATGVNINTVLVDNITITAVPEPSSAALLGLGGLTLILRRRK